MIHSRLAVRYSTLDAPPSPLPSGYAALLHLYGLRRPSRILVGGAEELLHGQSGACDERAQCATRDTIVIGN